MQAAMKGVTVILHRRDGHGEDQATPDERAPLVRGRLFYEFMEPEIAKGPGFWPGPLCRWVQ
jgi:hypothetical protein